MVVVYALNQFSAGTALSTQGTYTWSTESTDFIGSIAVDGKMKLQTLYSLLQKAPRNVLFLGASQGQIAMLNIVGFNLVYVKSLQVSLVGDLADYSEFSKYTNKNFM